MNVPSITVELDIDRDDTWSVDLSARIGSVAGARVHISRGMDKDGRVRIGEMTVVANNDDGAFTPEYTSGTYYGKLDDPAIPIRATLTHTFEGVAYTYSLFKGYTLDYRVRVGPPGQNTVTIQSVGVWRLIEAAPGVLLDVATDRTTGSAIEAGFAALGLDSSLYDCDAGEEALAYHFEGKTTPAQFFQSLVASELGGTGFEDGNGAVRFEGRKSRLGLSQFHRAQMRRAPVLLLTFGEATGTTAYDHSGNAHNGAYQNSPTLGATGLLAASPETAVDMESGSSQYVSIADHNDLDVADTFTLEALVKPEAIGSAMAITSKGSGEFYLNINAGGELVLEKTGVGAIVTSTVTLAAGTAYHVVATKSGATVKLYVDGVDVSGVVSNQTMTTSANELLVGVLVGGSAYFDGVIQRFALYPTALTAAQVQANYLAYRLGLWGDGSDVAPSVPPVYERSLDELVTKVTARGRVFREGQTVTFWEDHAARNPFDPTADATLSLAAGEVYVDEIVIPGAIVTLVTPAANIDYRANTAADRSGTDRTSSLTVTLSALGGGAFRRKLQNEHASDTIYVTEFRVRAAPLESLYDETATVVESTIAGLPVGQEVSLDIPWVGGPGSKLRDFAFQLRETYDLAYPWVTVTLAWDDDETIATCGWLEIGTLVKFKDQASGAWGTYVNDWWYVASIEHDVSLQSEGQAPYSTTVTLYPSHLHRLVDQMLYDDFDREDISGGLGISRSDDDWANDSGFDITSGVAVPNTGTAALATVSLGALAFDQALAVQLSAMTGSAVAGLMARYIDTSNYWRCVFVRASNQVQLIKTVAGTPTTVATATWTAAATGTLHWFVQGNRHRVYVNRKMAIDEEDTALNTGTTVGLYHSGASGDAAFERAYAGRL